VELRSNPLRLLVFDLDGCLWKPELIELLACRDGAPFSNDPRDTIPGTRILSRKGEKVELLGDTFLTKIKAIMESVHSP
jgi:hypothetical protein